MPTTTDHLRTCPDFFLSCSELKKKKKSINNPEYEFSTTHFTAGDERQFETYACLEDFISSGGGDEPTTGSLSIWEKFTHGNDSMNTFQYLFHKFKKGIYIQFQESQLKVFLPFSNVKFTNEWSHRIDTSNYLSVLKQVYKHSSYSFDEMSINCPQKWYANNSIFRYEFPVCENDSGIPILSDMFSSLGSSFSSSSFPLALECFLNKRDHPVMRLDGSEAYTAIFGESTPLQSHSYHSYAPILSMCSHDLYADIAIPTWEDWALANAPSKIFPKCQYLIDLKTAPIPSWESRLPVAVFRGGSTGKGITPETNPRLKVAYLSAHENPNDSDGLPLLDAGITMWNSRPRIENGKLITFSDETIQSIPLAPFLSLPKQMRYKYIIDIEGHVCAYRLSSELYMESVILLVASRYKLWFSHLLVEYVHYVPVKEDLSNLFTQIRWCKSHDSQCKQIAQNAKRFYNTYLTREGILAHLESILTDLCAQRAPYKNSLSRNRALLTQGRNVNQRVSSSSFDEVNNRIVSSLIPLAFQAPTALTRSSFADELSSLSPREFVARIQTIIESLLILQQSYLFNHNSLSPENVYFEKEEKGQCRATFTNFSRASCVDSNGVFFGSGWTFHPSHDLIILIMDCVSRLLSQKVSKDGLNILFWISTLFSFHKGYGIGRPFKTVLELKRFVHPKRIKSIPPQASFSLTLIDIAQFLSSRVSFHSFVPRWTSILTLKEKDYILFHLNLISVPPNSHSFTWNQVLSGELDTYFQSECSSVDLEWGRFSFGLLNNASLLEYICLRNTYLSLSSQKSVWLNKDLKEIKE